MSSVSSSLALKVAKRAGFRCEYCRSPQAITGQTFHAGRTPTGRATISALQLNGKVLMRARQMWVLLRLLP